MIHFSRKLFKKPPNIFSPFFVRPNLYAFASHEAEEPAAEDNEEAVVEEVSAKEKKPKRKKPRKKILNSDESALDISTLPKEAFPKDPIYSIEQESDSEIGNLPDMSFLFETDEKRKEAEEDVISQMKSSKKYKMDIPIENDGPLIANTVEMKKLLDVVSYIYKKQPEHFYTKYMRRDMKTQMEMFPHTVQDQSFNMPFDQDEQIAFVKHMIDRTDDLKNVFKPAVGTNLFSFEDRKGQPKNYRAFVGKEMFRLIKGNEENKKTGLMVTNVYNFLLEAFNESNYDVINPKDFRYLITRDEFLEYSHVFFNQHFFKNNPYLIGNYEFEDVLKRCLTDTKFYKNLEVFYSFYFFADKSIINSFFCSNLVCKISSKISHSRGSCTQS